ncbi:MAG: alanine racemase [Clostridia bacterium]|nr:alanine racemase [Clostridia bacterium]
MTAEISLQRLQHNARAFIQRTGKPICAVVKADAYGHGAVETVNALQGLAQCFAVSILDEAIAIRVASCGKEILIFTPPLTLQEAVVSVQNGFSVTVDSMRTARLVAKATQITKKAVNVHLKCNTGMNRYGVDIRGLERVCNYLKTCSFVQVKGLYSHLYTTDRQTSQGQLQSFLQMRAFALRYYTGLTCHISATYGALLGGAFVLDMTRIGLGLYGYLPSGVQVNGLQVKPCMRVYADVSAVHVYQGGGAGYGTPKQTLRVGDTLNVVRCGYADGVLRGDADGFFNTLCMDAHVRIGSKKVGEKVPVMVDADEIARRTGTVSYEVLCAVTRRAERKYTYGDFTVCREHGNGRGGTKT